MPEVPVKNLDGAEVERIVLSDEVFGAKVNPGLMHQAVLRLQAGRRAGTHKAKTRSEVTGGGAKPWRQKGTGRARQGSRNAPHWKGGGVAFPPTPRSYKVTMPKKMRRQATRSALSSRLSDEGIVVVSNLEPAEARTKHMVGSFKSLEASGRILLVDRKIGLNTTRASQNISGVAMKPASTVNIIDVLDHDVLVFSIEGIRELERLLSDGNV